MPHALLEDLRRYPGPWPRRLRRAASAPGFWAVAAFRMMQAVNALPRPVSLAVKAWARPLNLAVQLATGINLSPQARIGPGLYIGHWGGIVVSPEAELGAWCNLSQGVTIGVADGRDGARGAPRLGDRVYVAPGAKLFGPIRVGSGAAVGANAVVNHDVPEGVTVAGVPAKVVSLRGSRGLIDTGRDEPERRRA